MKLWAATLLILFAGCAIASGGKKEVHVNADAEALREENTKLKAEVEQLRGEVKQLRADLERMRGDPPARSIAGRVTAVEDTCVRISVGDADGVRVGDIFHLRRGAIYVGRVTIQDVKKNESVAEFDTEYPGRIGPPRAGDLTYVAHD
ncbi:MAG: coiled-coil domain-containing protein [Planctomycetota bacterium]|jgi:cell shape-determining protein MreC